MFRLLLLLFAFKGYAAAMEYVMNPEEENSAPKIVAVLSPSEKFHQRIAEFRHRRDTRVAPLDGYDYPSGNEEKSDESSEDDARSLTTQIGSERGDEELVDDLACIDFGEDQSDSA